MSKRNKQPITPSIAFDGEWTREQEELTQQLLQAKYNRFATRKLGAPTVLTPDLIERFLMAARQGLPVELICNFCLIDTALFYQWRDWAGRIRKRIEPILARAYKAQMDGEEYHFTTAERHSLRLSADETLIINFFDKLTMIKGEYGLRIMTGLNVAALGGNTNAATWLLKSSFPEHYSEVNAGQSDGDSASAGYAYIEVNAEEPEPERLMKNVTPQPVLNGENLTENVSTIQ